MMFGKNVWFGRSGCHSGILPLPSTSRTLVQNLAGTLCNVCGLGFQSLPDCMGFSMEYFSGGFLLVEAWHLSCGSCARHQIIFMVNFLIEFEGDRKGV